MVDDAEIFYLVQLSFGRGSEERVIDLDMAIRCRCLSCIDPPPNGLELCRKIGDGVNQAADLISATASIPSLNFIPLTTFGNWF